MASFRFLHEAPADTLAQAAAGPLRLCWSALDAVGRLVETDGQRLGGLRREAFARSRLRPRH